tara:strand:+ start:341 stop:925 length:585 start_codon:yes stop_codon:yes gene_type:complete
MEKQLKIILCSAISCLILVKANIANSQSLDEELKKCSEITVSLIRFQCYDRLAKAPEVSSAQPAAEPKRRSLFQRRARNNSAQNERQPNNTKATQQDSPPVAQTQNNTQSSDSFGQVSEDQTSEITSRIIGKFDGWTGDTLFRLENGQVWRQSGNGFLKVSMNNPKVTIEKATFGGFRLSVEGYNSRVKVKRVQ